MGSQKPIKKKNAKGKKSDGELVSSERVGVDEPGPGSVVTAPFPNDCIVFLMSTKTPTLDKTNIVTQTKRDAARILVEEISPSLAILGLEFVSSGSVVFGFFRARQSR